MILPVALVDRKPGEQYLVQHKTIESALKHNVSDLRRLWHDVRLLRDYEKFLASVVESSDDDSTEKTTKRKKIEGFELELRKNIISRDEELARLIKCSDYPAMVMASYPESKFLSKSKYWKQSTRITSPVLIRGIASAKIGDDVVARGNDYYFIETGYLGNYRCPNNQTGRKVYHRIVKNAMQHQTIMDVPDDRWRKLVDFNPNMEYKGWRQPGSKILIVLSTQKPFEYYKEDQAEWLKNVVSTLKQHTDREIVFRNKASRGERTNDTIYDALDDDIYAVVTYNSVAAVEAIQYGIPAFALAPTAADPVGNKDLSMIETPNRPSEELVQKWLHSIAYGQFSLDEILTGQAWKLVLENAERSTIDS